jgi:hypothetical protein
MLLGSFFSKPCRDVIGKVHLGVFDFHVALYPSKYLGGTY